MHSLAAASRPRLSETKPNWFMFELPAMRSVGESIASQNYRWIQSTLFTVSYVFLLQVVPLDIHFYYIDNTFICITTYWRNWVNKTVERNTPARHSMGFRHLVSVRRRTQRWDRTYYRSSICHYSELCIQVNVDQLGVGVTWLRIVVRRQVESRIEE